MTDGFTYPTPWIGDSVTLIGHVMSFLHEGSLETLAPAQVHLVQKGP